VQYLGNMSEGIELTLFLIGIMVVFYIGLYILDYAWFKEFKDFRDK
jgi:hypothetical protein